MNDDIEKRFMSVLCCIQLLVNKLISYDAFLLYNGGQLNSTKICQEVTGHLVLMHRSGSLE